MYRVVCCVCWCSFSNDQTRKSFDEEDAWRLWWIRCTVYAKICAARSGYTWQWTGGHDTSRWCASSAVISEESYKCTVYECVRYLRTGHTDTPISIWGAKYVSCFFLVLPYNLHKVYFCCCSFVAATLMYPGFKRVFPSLKVSNWTSMRVMFAIVGRESSYLCSLVLLSFMMLNCAKWVSYWVAPNSSSEYIKQ